VANLGLTGRDDNDAATPALRGARWRRRSPRRHGPCGRRGVVSVWSVPGLWPRDRPGSGAGGCVTGGVWSVPGLWPRDRPGSGAGGCVTSGVRW